VKEVNLLAIALWLVKSYVMLVNLFNQIIQLFNIFFVEEFKFI